MQEASERDCQADQEKRKKSRDPVRGLSLLRNKEKQPVNPEPEERDRDGTAVRGREISMRVELGKERLTQLNRSSQGWRRKVFQHS